jgi:hypothetical protein
MNAIPNRRSALVAECCQPTGAVFVRWPIGQTVLAARRTNRWLSNFGHSAATPTAAQPTDMPNSPLAVALLLVAKLIDWRNRWSPIR